MTSMLEVFQQGHGTPSEAAEMSIALAKSAKEVFISVCGERAQVEAETSTLRQQKGRLLGPLDGMPIAWKDNIDLRGMVTTGGTKVLSRNPAGSDAALVKKLTSCGVVSVGKTNMSELAFSGLGLNPHHGTPTAESPGTHAPGGSSSGAAVAVARGIVPVSVGTDTAGSLRVPAAFNGVCAFRPSVGRHSFDGVMPLAPTMDTVGFLARFPEDILKVEQELVPDSTSYPDSSSLEMVFDPNWLESESISDEVLTAFYNHLEDLKDLGAVVIEQDIPALGEFFALLDKFGWLGGYEAALSLRPLMDEYQRQDFDVRVWDRVHAVSEHAFERVIQLTSGRRRLLKALPQQLGKNLLLMPTVAHTAPELSRLEQDSAYFAETNMATLRLTMFGSFLDTPAFATPSGVTAEGQFCSVQWLAPQGNDQRLLRAVRQVSIRKNKNQ